MFTQKCFIRKNTPELIKILKDIGQRENTLDDFNGEWLAANYGMFISVNEGFQNLHPEDIDCGTNEDLFLALAALRDDSDYMQWFVAAEDESRPTLCKKELIEEHTSWYELYRKMTVEELIEHFNRNKHVR